MKKFLIISLIAIGCGESQPEELFLTEDFYEWHCSESGDIIVSTETYECHETGLHYLVAVAHMIDGEHFKINLKNDAPCENAHWEERIPISVFGYECADPGNPSDVDGVTLTAYVDEATLSGALFGD